MRKLFGVLFLSLGVFGLIWVVNRGHAQNKDGYICNAVALACGGCTQNGPVCWHYTGEGTADCIKDPEPTVKCNPKERQIICTKNTFTGSCAGVGCLPAQCCEEGVLISRDPETRDTCTK